MLTAKQIKITSAALALALVAAVAAAGEDDVEDVAPAAYRTAQRGAGGGAPRQVKIWSGSPSLTAARLAAEQEETPPLPPSAPNGDQPWEGVDPNPRSPFLDDSANGYGGGGGGCDSGTSGCGEACNPGCDTCDPCMCGPAWWAHRSFIFGQYLYLQPTGVDIAHAIQQNGAGGAGTTPEGRVGVVNQNYTSAYAFGFGVAMGPCASIQASYTNFHSHNTDSLAASGLSGGTVASLVFHPESINEGSTSSLVDAAADIDFETADVEYRRMFAGGCRYALNYSVGARYAKLDQSFLQIGNFAPPTGTIETSTNITFEGGGLKTGLDGMQRLGHGGFGVYGKTFLSLVFGTFRTNYEQFDITTDSVQAASNWNDQRVVPILEYEVGLNYTSRGGHWRSSIGYYTAFWFNTIATPEYVQAVQFADFVDLGETIAFDGIVSRVEFRY
ncbi:MAG: Lpg1974 family pore-forming outer membrane protein [Pirellulales bacterium]